MEIRDHRLAGSGTAFLASPNHGAIFAANLPDTIVVHYTAGSAAESSIQTMCNPANKVSAHLVVARDGQVTQLVPFNTVAWHAGKSTWQGRNGLNQYAIGIEIDNAGILTKSGDRYAAWFGRLYDPGDVIQAAHRNESHPKFWHRYAEEQIDKVFELCTLLIDHYSIKTIVGHEEISPGRKTDPGPAFPLDKLRERVLIRDRSVDEGIAPAVVLHASGTVTAGSLNVRSGPGLGSAIISPPLPAGAQVEIVNEADGWYEIVVNTRGWVKKDFIRIV